MARRINNVKLETRSARRKLEVSSNPYWIRIERRSYFGYRKGKLGGYWIAKIRDDETGNIMTTLGVADDTSDSDGVGILDYFQAQEKARVWIQEISKIEKGKASINYTVNDALDDYIEYLEHYAKSSDRAVHTANAHVRPKFGDKKVSKLTAKEIAEWHRNLVYLKPRQRSKKGTISYREYEKQDAEYKRRRKSTANRIFTVLKASLNRAYQEGKVPSDDAWRRVKPFRNVENAKVRYLTVAETKRLVQSSAHDFKPLVQSAILTGCRYGELINLRVKDYDPLSGTVFIAEAKSGKPRYVTLEKQGIDFFNKHAEGKASDELILTRNTGEQWGRSHQTRRLKEACQSAQIKPEISFHILRHTYASQLVQRGVPLTVIAHQLGHSDTRICEKYYAHLSPTYISETVRKNFPVFNFDDE